VAFVRIYKFCTESCTSWPLLLAVQSNWMAERLVERSVVVVVVVVVVVDLIQVIFDLTRVAFEKI